MNQDEQNKRMGEAIAASYSSVRSIAKHEHAIALLKRTPLDALKWRHHGLGMLQGEIDETTRVHIWDPQLRTIPFDGFRDVHDHRFDLESTVLIGAVEDVRYHVSSRFADEGDTDCWEIKHAKIQIEEEGRDRLASPGGQALPVRDPKDSVNTRLTREIVSTVDTSAPEGSPNCRHIGRAEVIELGRAVFPVGSIYSVQRRVFHTTRIERFSVTLVRRSNFDERPARILGRGFSAIQRADEKLIGALVDRAVREVRGMR